jgi:hypothetical protein
LKIFQLILDTCGTLKCSRLTEIGSLFCLKNVSSYNHIYIFWRLEVRIANIIISLLFT